MDLSLNNNLPHYNAIKDKYLESYFQSPTIQSHLRHIGLMTKDGRVVTDEEFKRAAIRRQQRWAARQHMAQMAVVDNRDFQLGRQLELRKQLDAVQKIETYRRVKGGNSSNGHELVHIQPLDLEQSLNRSRSAPGLRMFRSSSVPIQNSSPEQQLHSSGYQTDDDRPRSMPQTQQSLQSSRARSLRRRYLSDQYRFQYLHKLDNSSLQEYENHLQNQLMSIEKYQRRIQNYFSFDERLGMLPSPYNSFQPQFLSLLDYRRRSLSSTNSSARWNHTKFNNESMKRTRSISPTKQNKARQKQIFVTSAAARKRRQLQPSCECFLQFLGVTDGKQASISITQQHSGGNNIVVFKEDLTPNAKFQFVSYRQKGFPFSLTISEDNQVIQTTSTCCESRYTVGSKLGGKQGFFKWLGVKNAVPCYKCQVHRGLTAPFTNFGQLKKKIKRVKKKKSQDEYGENEEANNSDTEAAKREEVPISGKPPRPRSARSKSRGSITSLVGTVAAGAAVAATATTLAAIEDQDEGLHSKVPSEHGSSLNASSDEENKASDDEKPKSAKSTRSAKSKASRRKSSSATEASQKNDDFFDDRENKDGKESTDKKEDASEHSGSNSESGSDSRSDEGSGSESESEQEKDKQEEGHGKWGLEKEHSLEHKEITENGENSADQEVEKEENKETTEENQESGTESESKDLDESQAKSRKSSTQSENKSRRSSVVSRTKSRQSSVHEETSSKHEETLNEETPNENKEIVGENNTTLETAEIKDVDDTTSKTAKEEKSGSESESESASDSLSESEDESVSKSAPADPNNQSSTSFAEKLKEASSALLEGHNETNGGGETVVLVDVHQTNSTNLDTKPWICNECNFDNDGDEYMCRICGAPKGSEPTVAPDENGNLEEKTADAEETTGEVEPGPNEEAEAEGKTHSESESEAEDTTAKEETHNDAITDNKSIHEDGAGEQSEQWTCKFCATVNEPTAERCATCLLPQEYTRPNTGNVTSEHTNPFSSTSDDVTNKTKEYKEEEEGHDEETTAYKEGEGEEEKTGEASRRSSAAKSRRSEGDTDTLADARSIRSQVDVDGTRLVAPEIQIQPASPSIATTPKPLESPRSQEIVAEIRNIEVDQALSYLKEFSAENLGQARSDTDDSKIEAAQENQEEAIHEADTPEVVRPVEHVEGLPDELVEDLLKPEAVLHKVDLSKSEVEIVADLLSKNESLNSLTIKDARFTEEHLEVVANALKDGQPNLRVLNLNVNLLTSLSVPMIRSLLLNHPIEILSLHDNQLNDGGVEDLLSNLISIQQNGGTKLRRLDIGENEMRTDAAKRLGEYLETNHELQSLIISGSSNIDEEGWRAISEGLSKNTSLQALRLDYCQLGDSNMEIICNALKDKHELTTLDIEGNNLNDKSAAEIVELVRSCHNLKNIIWLAGNNVSGEYTTRVDQIIEGREHPEVKDHLSVATALFPH